MPNFAKDTNGGRLILDRGRCSGYESGLWYPLTLKEQLAAMYSEVDLDIWPRRSTYEFFKDYEDPFFNFTANLDATNVYGFVKSHRLSFSLTVLYCSLIAANAIREFRIRMMDGRFVEFDRIHATQTILNDDKTFSFAYFEMHDDVFEFNAAGREAMAKYKQLKTFDVETDRLDLIYYSVIPWVSFTSFKHASQLNRTQTIPRMVFGKLFNDRRDGKQLPMSVEANHMIMDGFHVGQFFIKFQQALDSLLTSFETTATSPTQSN